MYAFAGNVFGSSRLGRYTFNNSSAVGKTIGVPFAAFLLGYPDSTNLADVLAPDMNGRGNAYAFYVQDDWKVTSSLTVNFGLRYEYHPMLRDRFENTAHSFAGLSTRASMAAMFVAQSWFRHSMRSTTMCLQASAQEFHHCRF